MRISDWSSDVCSSDLEEIVVLLERDQRLAQRPRDGGYVDQFGGGQIVEILVDRLAGVDLVLDAVEPGHPDRGVAQIVVRHRVGEATPAALGLGAGATGTPARGRTVEARIISEERPVGEEGVSTGKAP